MKSMPFLEDWNRNTAWAVACGLLFGFLSGLFTVSVPFTHTIGFGQYRFALMFAFAFFLAGMIAVDFRFKRFKNAYPEELTEVFFCKSVHSRVYSGYVMAFFLTYAVVYFAWFLLRTQFQWTSTVLLIAQAVVYFFYCIFAYISVRDESTKILNKYHPLPELDLGADCEFSARKNHHIRCTPSSSSSSDSKIL